MIKNHIMASTSLLPNAGIEGIVYTGIWDRKGLVMRSYRKGGRYDIQIVQNLVETKVFQTVDLLVNNKKSFEGSPALYGLTIQYVVDEEVCFLTCATPDFQTRICFLFLDWLANQYKLTSIRDDLSNFNEKVYGEMVRYSTDPSVDKIKSLQNKVSEIQSILEENIQLVLNRGEKLNNINEKAERMEETTRIFRKSAKEVRCAMCVENQKMTLILGGVIILAILIVIVFVTIGIYVSRNISGI